MSDKSMLIRISEQLQTARVVLQAAVDAATGLQDSETRGYVLGNIKSMLAVENLLGGYLRVRIGG